MKRFNISLVAEGLAAYTIERQNGWERHQPEGAPTWAERRRFWTDAILQGMARLEGQGPDPKWLLQFDLRLTDGRYRKRPWGKEIRWHDRRHDGRFWTAVSFRCIPGITVV